MGKGLIKNDVSVNVANNMKIKLENFSGKIGKANKAKKIKLVIKCNR